MFSFILKFAKASDTFSQIREGGFGLSRIYEKLFGKPSIITGDPLEVVTSKIFEIIKYVLGFTGILGIIVIIYGGFIWMFSGGNQEKVARAKRIILYTFIGLGLIIGASTIVVAIMRILISFFF